MIRMPFPAKKLSPLLQEKILRLLNEINLVDFYKSYVWKQDTYDTHFSKILNLELVITQAAKNNSLNTSHLKEIAIWGCLRNKVDIFCINEPLNLPIYHEDKAADWIQSKPEEGIQMLRPQIYGFGPTYLTKLLRFALPSEYGVIDTQLVRVFGIGDIPSKKVQLINLEYSGSDISTKSPWPEDYGKWISILRFISKEMEESGINCPHPRPFIEEELRLPDIWTCADVEMALFSFAEKHIKTKKV